MEYEDDYDDVDYCDRCGREVDPYKLNNYGICIYCQQDELDDM